MVHDIGATSVSTQWHSAADDLAECRHVGGDTESLLGATKRQPESGHHFVKNQNRTVSGCLITQTAQELWRAGDTAHVADHRFQDYRCDFSGILRKGVSYGVTIVVFQYNRVGHGPGGNAWRIGNPESRSGASGGDE